MTNKVLALIICSLTIYSCSRTEQYIRQDDLFKSYYFSKLHYPYSMDEMLQMYRDGVFEKLYNESQDSIAAKSFMESHIQDNDSLLAIGSEGMEYLWFYNYLIQHVNDIEYVLKGNHIEIRNKKENTVFLIPQYDLGGEMRLQHSNSTTRYHRIKKNSYFYEDICSDDTIKLSDEDLNIWDNLVRGNSKHIMDKDKEFILVEYLENNGVYIVDNPKIVKIKRSYHEQIQNILPSIEEFLKTRHNIKRITFPMFVDKKNKKSSHVGRYLEDYIDISFINDTAYIETYPTLHDNYKIVVRPK